MKKIFISFVLLIISIVLISSDSIPTTPEEVIAEIPFIQSFKKIKTDTFFKSTYELYFKMPVDHKNSNGPVFPLRAYYSHKGFDKPMVVVLDGYVMYTSKANELTKILDANQLTIEHRFFGSSRPKDSIPWNYLNIWQAAADQHQIIQAFRSYYKSKWISTGISKSGQTCIFHRRFYSKDVDVSVPYVAPLNFSNEDGRVYSFLKNVGTEDCRNKIYEYQQFLLKYKKRYFPMFEKAAKQRGWKFSMGLERAYELSVLEYGFAFWQWGVKCESIPGKSSSDQEVFAHLCSVDPFSFFEETETENNRVFFYQAMTEMGMYGYEVQPFKKYIDDNKNITFDFTMPKGHTAVFRPEVMKDINQWVKDSGNYMLYIYGQNDAWSSTAVDPGNKTNAAKFLNPGGNHTTRIEDFPVPLQDSIYHVLGNWLQMDLKKR